jgi:hypothetical protein
MPAPAAGSRLSPTAQPAAADASAVRAAREQADGLVARVRQLIDGYDSIQCGVRHRIDLFDTQIRGEGVYYQQGHGLRRLMHFELRSKIGNQITTLFEVSDGNFFWTFRETPAGVPSLTRVDLGQVSEAWNQARRAMPSAPAPKPSACGLPKLLDGIAENFSFERITAGRLGDRPVWMLEGSWRPDKLAAAVPDQSAAIKAGRPLELKRLPAQLPERIVLEIAQDDLFPCELEYLRRGGGSAGQGRAGEGGEAPGYRPIVAMQWFDVRVNQPIDPRKFIYQPVGQPWIDATEQCLKTLNLITVQKQ